MTDESSSCYVAVASFALGGGLHKQRGAMILKSLTRLTEDNSQAVSAPYVLGSSRHKEGPKYFKNK